MPEFSTMLPEWVKRNNRKVDPKTAEKIKRLKTGEHFNLEVVKTTYHTTYYRHGDKHILLIPSMHVCGKNRDDHPHIFAFSMDDSGSIKCRYFWSSRSEGCWRAGTGYDDNQEGRFKKGMQEASGYIFETQTAPSLNALLDDIHNDSACEVLNGSIKDKLAMCSGAKTLLVGADPELLKDYRNETKYIKVFRGPLDLSIYNVDPNDPSQGSLLTKGAAKFQAFGQVLSKQGYTKTTEITEQQFKKIKKRENIWDIILKCLLNPQKNNNYKY